MASTMSHASSLEEARAPAYLNDRNIYPCHLRCVASLALNIYYGLIRLCFLLLNDFGVSISLLRMVREAKEMSPKPEQVSGLLKRDKKESYFGHADGFVRLTKLSATA